MPPTQNRLARKKRHSRRRSQLVLKKRHSSIIGLGCKSPTLRRHSSFHSRSAPMTNSIPQRPNHKRHVSFSLDAASIMRGLPRKTFGLGQFVDSPESTSHRSSEDSGMSSSFFGSSSFKSCESSTNTIEPGNTTRPSPMQTPLLTLGKCFPGMKIAAFTSAGKRKSSASSAASFQMSHSPSLPISLPSKLECQSSGRLSTGTTDSINTNGNGDGSGDIRSSFVRQRQLPFLPGRFKTTPLSRAYYVLHFYFILSNLHFLFLFLVCLIVVQQVDLTPNSNQSTSTKKSGIVFANPWSTSRTSTTASPSPTFSAGTNPFPSFLKKILFIKHF